jgi:hypothetical protein
VSRPPGPSVWNVSDPARVDLQSFFAALAGGPMETRQGASACVQANAPLVTSTRYLETPPGVETLDRVIGRQEPQRAGVVFLDRRRIGFRAFG